MFRSLIALIFACSSGLTCFADETTIRFNRDIRPVLTDKCFACHGPDAQTVEGGLRLDLPEEAKDDSLGAIVPGAPDESEVVRRIFSDDHDELMPPPHLHKPMTEDEKQLIKRWIAQGAPYEAHWAYEPMRDLDDSDPDNQDRVRATAKMIDRTILNRLENEQVHPVPTADRITLIRRLSLDLTGIPPTPQEVDQFVNDDSKNAYSKLVDRLLNSPRFGERMAVYWLDLVRYADTVGYHGDQNVSQSPYRDYVISAFNDNMPYDQFVVEQLAGDLLPNATLNQRVASGYNRLNQTTEEGGSQAKEYLAIYFADRVRNVSQVFMGATMGCAQCHDHKYDPYTMKDFYSLGAFFADLDERGVYSARSRPPMIRVPSAQLEQRLAEMDHQISELQSKASEIKDTLVSKQSDWEAAVRPTLDDLKEVEKAWVDDALLIDAKTSGDWKFVPAKKKKSKSAQQPPVHKGSQSRRQKADGLVQHLFQNAKEPYVVGENSQFYCWVHLDAKSPPKAIMIQLNDGDWSQRKVWGGDQISYGLKPESHNGYRRAGKLPAKGEWIRLEVTAKEVGLKSGDKISGMAFTQFGGLVHWDDCGVIESEGIPAGVVEALRVSHEERSAEQAQRVRKHFLENAPEVIAINQQIQSLQDARDKAAESAPLTVVSQAVSPRTIRILPRGNWMDDSGAVVEPAIPEFLGKLETGDHRPTRLDLAKWLCEADNPLTARTMVNRLWALLFGRGICTSVDDFGGQGTYPSYPDLLDALGVEFVRSGWDIKQIIRGIVSSETYRRSSIPTKALQKRDPYNDLFARQGRFTVEAEVVRDSALSISGLLVEQLGGASAKPYQPKGYYAQLNFPRRTYESDRGANQYRRGLYTHWQRTFLHPMLKAFDAPSREECTAKRARSNTPLQALVLLNDPTFVESARVFAERIMRNTNTASELNAPSSTDLIDQQIRWAYRQSVSHSANDEIVKQLHQLYQQHLQHYQGNLADAEMLIDVGQAPVPTDLDKAELAAWTSVARVILNLHETITRY